MSTISGDPGKNFDNILKGLKKGRRVGYQEGKGFVDLSRAEAKKQGPQTITELSLLKTKIEEFIKQNKDQLTRQNKNVEELKSALEARAKSLDTRKTGLFVGANAKQTMIIRARDLREIEQKVASAARQTIQAQKKPPAKGLPASKKTSETIPEAPKPIIKPATSGPPVSPPPTLQEMAPPPPPVSETTNQPTLQEMAPPPPPQGGMPPPPPPPGAPGGMMKTRAHKLLFESKVPLFQGEETFKKPKLRNEKEDEITKIKDPEYKKDLATQIESYLKEFQPLVDRASALVKQQETLASQIQDSNVMLHSDEQKRAILQKKTSDMEKHLNSNTQAPYLVEVSSKKGTYTFPLYPKKIMDDALNSLSENDKKKVLNKLKNIPTLDDQISSQKEEIETLTQDIEKMKKSIESFKTSMKETQIEGLKMMGIKVENESQIEQEFLKFKNATTKKKEILDQWNSTLNALGRKPDTFKKETLAPKMAPLSSQINNPPESILETIRAFESIEENQDNPILTSFKADYKQLFMEGH